MLEKSQELLTQERNDLLNRNTISKETDPLEKIKFSSVTMVWVKNSLTVLSFNSIIKKSSND